MLLTQLFAPKILKEGGNLGSHKADGTPMPGWQGVPGEHQAQHLDLQVHNRNYIVPVLNTLLQSINSAFEQQYQTPLWSPKLLKSREFLSGSSLHFFNTDIPDDEFVRVKPKVGDIDTQVNKESESAIAEFLNSIQGQVVGNATFLGYSRGNEQYSSLWELTDPPIKVQIDLEFVAYEKDKPTDWAQFSHSSSWSDLEEGIKGVFHKWLIQSFTTLTRQEFLLRKLVGRGKARAERDIPTTDNMISFAVSSKEGGGLRTKYEPVEDEKGRPLVIDGLPVMREAPKAGYEQNLTKIFQIIFGDRVAGGKLKGLLSKTWSFTGLLEVMNLVLTPEEKELVVGAFIQKLFGNGAQGLYKNDPQRDLTEKNVALNFMFKKLGIAPPDDLEQMRQDYVSNYRMTTEGPIGLDKPALAEAEVQAQLRKNMPHLKDLKPIDFLDLVDELHQGNGKFKLENIPLNVKVDGFGGRFGKSADGRPFMGTSNTPPRFEAGFVKRHQEKGTTDPEILGRAQKFDQLFNEMIGAVSIIDEQLGPDVLLDKQVTCEVLFLPFATETPEGKLKFVGIHYDKLPEGVELALVPYRVTDATSGEDLPDSDKIVKAITGIGQAGSVMFISNRLTQKEGLDVTEIINVLDNIDELKAIVSDTQGKRDKASLALRREVEAKLQPVKERLEQAIINDPNIVGKDMLGQDYEGIVINSRLGPIKITSQQQRDVISAKNAAKKAARAEQPRENTNKTAVVAIGSFVGHIGHEQLFDYTIKKAEEVGGDPYLFIGNAVGADDPIPPDVKVKTWHKMYPQYAQNISTVQTGGSLIQKIKHELINPLPGKPPRYDNVIIMVGEDQAGMNIANALMKAVNKFQGYEHVKVSLGVTPRGTGMSFTKLRNILKDPNATPEQQLQLWTQAFDVKKLGVDYIKYLMDITRKGMGIQQMPQQQPVPERLFNALVMDQLYEGAWGKAIGGGLGGLAGGVAGTLVAPGPGTLAGEIGGSYYGSKLGDKLTGPDEVDEDDEWEEESGKFKRFMDHAKEQLLAVDKTQRMALAKRLSAMQVKYFGPEDSNSYDPNTGAAIASNSPITASIRDLLDVINRPGGNSPFGHTTVDFNKQREPEPIRPEPVAPTPATNNVSYDFDDAEDDIDDISEPEEDSDEEMIEKSQAILDFYNNADPETRAELEAALSRDLKMSAEEVFDKLKQIADGDVEVGRQLMPIAEARMSNAVKLQRAFNREQEKSAASRKRGEEVMNKAKQDTAWEKTKQTLSKPENMGVLKRLSQKEGVAESSSGAKYKVKSIGKDKKGDYYVSPNTGKKVYKKANVGDHETPSGEVKPKVGEAMLPTSAFAGSKKNKLGTAGQWRNKGPKANRPAKAGDLVGGAAESFEYSEPTIIDKLKSLKQKAARAKENNDNYAFHGYMVDYYKTLVKYYWDNDDKAEAEKYTDLYNKHYSEMKRHHRDDWNPLEEKIKGADGKACWKGYKYAGTENGKDKCVPVREDVENIISSLVEQLSRK